MRIRRAVVTIIGPVAAAGLTVAVCWTVLALLAVAGTAAGEVGAFLRTDPGGTAAAVAAALGSPVDWTVAGVTGRIHPLVFLRDGSPLVLLLAGPLAGIVLLGRLERRRPPRRPRAATATAKAAATAAAKAAAAGAGYAATLTGIVAVGARLGGDPVVHLSAPLGVVAAAALAWAWCGLAGAALLRTLPRPEGARPPLPRRRAAAAVLAVAASALLVAGTPAAAAPDRIIPFGGGSSAVPHGHQRPGVAAALGLLRDEEGAEPLVAHEPWRGTPSSISTHSPLGGDGVPGWLRRHAGLFGIGDPGTHLRAVRDERDPTGVRHLWFEQHVGGVPVFGSTVGVHLDPTGRYVEFVSNGAEPALDAPARKPTVTADQAVAGARLALPGGRARERPRLYLLPAAPEPGKRTPTVLAWRAALSDRDAGIANAYFVDAMTGRLVYQLPLTAYERYRVIHDVERRTTLIGAQVRRIEGGAWTGITDVDAAYDNFGHAYNYFFERFARDSFDGQGAVLYGYVRYRYPLWPNEPFRNAYWDPVEEEMVFGEDMAVADVTAHELTHAVTSHTSDLLYMYQSGALNESFSDMFGETIEQVMTGRVDWLMGAQLPGGAIRSVADPPRYGHPGHYRDYNRTCNDNGGVHINSGIPNRAFFLLASQIGINNAARLAYFAQTYLTSRARFIDARIAFIEAAYQLHGKTSPEAEDAAAAWTEVGVDGLFEQPRQDCPCIADESLSGAGPGGLDPQGPGVDAVLAALLHVRDLFATGPNPALGHYEGVYHLAAPRAIQLMSADDGLRRRTAHLMQTLEPVLRAVGTTAGNTARVTPAMLAEVDSVLREYAAADRATGGGDLAARIEAELVRADLPHLAGLTANQALAHLDGRVG